MEAINPAPGTNYIFSGLCNEPKGEIERFVYPMILTPENLNKFWNKAKQFKALFWGNINGNFHRFLSTLVSQDGDRIVPNGLFWMVDDMVGVYYLTHLQSHDAQIHYAFFDRRQHGREELTKKMIKYVFEEYGFHRLSAEIPACFTSTALFVEKGLEMRLEGRKRNAALLDDKWYDVKCYGILKEETEKWV